MGRLDVLVGGLSQPSKMPGFAYGLPAKACIIGAILRKKIGSVCSKCYALKGQYNFPCVQKAQYRRLAIVQSDVREWANGMAKLIHFKYRAKVGPSARVFRWHDSGDLQSVEHLAAIVEIASVLPDIRFWLPTRESIMVQSYLRDNPQGFPRNLIVRLSVPMIGQTGFARAINGIVFSTVGSGKGYLCPARQQNNNCQDCRACWDKSVKTVDYPLH
jgi:hypothetical protein